MWIMGDTSDSTPSSLFPNTLIINADAPHSVKVDGEIHLDNKTAHRHGTQYIIAIQ
jgi:hypothetical protein